ncbi:MAG: alpha/beta fold hydrolase, partial [Ferruginibacter sp.]|nr:alpha/beta fold hydrolase [Cytophagales bacterium]
MPDRPVADPGLPAPERLRFSLNPFLTIAGEGWGDPTAPAVVLLHGGGQTRHSWGDTAHLLAQRGWYAVALDARGHGESSWSPDGQYRVEDLVDDLKEVVARLAAKPALVGASLGGITALLAEGESPVPFGSALVLVDTAPRVEPKGIERIFAFMSQHAAGFADLEEAAAAVAAYLPHRPRPSDGRRLAKNLRRETDGR